MKSFQDFLQESVNIQHVDTLIVNDSDSSTQSVGEDFSADIVYQGSLVLLFNRFMCKRHLINL
jgi:hypothetical protein